jgi:hypothetical protein
LHFEKTNLFLLILREFEWTLTNEDMTLDTGDDNIHGKPQEDIVKRKDELGAPHVVHKEH